MAKKTTKVRRYPLDQDLGYAIIDIPHHDSVVKLERHLNKLALKKHITNEDIHGGMFLFNDYWINDEGYAVLEWLFEEGDSLLSDALAYILQERIEFKSDRVMHQGSRGAFATANRVYQFGNDFYLAVDMENYNAKESAALLSLGFRKIKSKILIGLLRDCWGDNLVVTTNNVVKHLKDNPILPAMEKDPYAEENAFEIARRGSIKPVSEKDKLCSARALCKFSKNHNTLLRSIKDPYYFDDDDERFFDIDGWQKVLSETKAANVKPIKKLTIKDLVEAGDLIPCFCGKEQSKNTQKKSITKKNVVKKTASVKKVAKKKAAKKKVANPMKGMKFVITGKLPSMGRSEATEIIEDNGGKVVASISKNTDYLLSGEKTGTKLDKAKALGIKVITEQKFLKMLPQ